MIASPRRCAGERCMDVGEGRGVGEALGDCGAVGESGGDKGEGQEEKMHPRANANAVYSNVVSGDKVGKSEVE